jgi:cytochrome P450
LEAGKIPFDDMRDETGKKKRLAFMDFLIKEHLDSPEGFTERDIREEVDTFMFEGHDTTAWGISWSIYLLGLHPEKQRLVHEELDSIFGEDQEREFSQEDLRNMHYIECVVKEAQRLFPSVPVYARITTENVKVSIRSTGKVVYLPEGMNTAIFPSLVHRCPDHWEEPEKFIPERFLPENSKGRHPYAHIPFSAGPRNCIGQKFAILEEKAAIASIFRKFHVQSFDPRDKVFPIPALIFKANLPLKIKVSRRL